jgi:hypothetical protein
MFADVGLGTDKRESIRTPVASVVHLGRVDYVFVQTSEDAFEAREASVGEAHFGAIEILKGLRGGEQVVSKNAILLKPLLSQSLAR